MGIWFGFLGLQALLIVCLTILVGLGYDSVLTHALAGCSAALFAANIWKIFRADG